MKKLVFVIYSFTISVVVVQSCVYHSLDEMVQGTVPHTDDTLFYEITEVGGYEYYRNGSTLAPASASPHGDFKLRFNKIASDALGSDGELPTGETFPNGSVIVKEVYNANGLYVYAVMKKAPGDPSAGDDWLWAEYYPDGVVPFGISRRGNGCISCHDDSPNRNLVRTFDLH